MTDGKHKFMHLQWGGVGGVCCNRSMNLLNLVFRVLNGRRNRWIEYQKRVFMLILDGEDRSGKVRAEQARRLASLCLQLDMHGLRNG